jgi:hypothetical protein
MESGMFAADGVSSSNDSEVPLPGISTPYNTSRKDFDLLNGVRSVGIGTIIEG